MTPEYTMHAPPDFDAPEDDPGAIAIDINETRTLKENLARWLRALRVTTLAAEMLAHARDDGDGRGSCEMQYWDRLGAELSDMTVEEYLALHRTVAP